MDESATVREAAEIDGRTVIGWGFPADSWIRRGVALAREMIAEGLSQDEMLEALRLDRSECVGVDTAAMTKAQWKKLKRDKVTDWRRRFKRGLVTTRDDTVPPLTIRGEHEQHTLDQLAECARYGAVHGAALCADGHLGYAQPVGAVIAYKGQISVSGVGFDIACGNLAVKLDLNVAEMPRPDLEILADDIYKNIIFGVGTNGTTGDALRDRMRDRRVDHPIFDEDDAWKAGGIAELKSLAQIQLGTCGAGNHYVDVFADEEDFVWIGVHFGSRGLGHKIASRFLREGYGKDTVHAAPTILEEDSDIGRAYIAAMELAGKYAYAGREWVVDTIVEMIGASVVDTVHNHHNYAWREVHDGEALWVVRKGATPAFPGQRGFVGGSMGDDSVILEGVDSPTARSLFSSTVHGAGRVMGRRAAKKAFKVEDQAAWLCDRDVILRGGGLDEAPMAYRRLDDVLKAHADTIKVLHRLRPLIVVMADSEDPYGD
jgi:tRNA-splicing ligase RtcB (3'-phosphate/5'-hydroxy nucleic acid ligase)